MTPARAAPWRRLAPLAALVLAAHFALLQSAPRRLAPVRAAPVRAAPVPFATRSVMPAPAAPAVAPAPPAAAAASPAALPKTAPPAVRQPQRGLSRGTPPGRPAQHTLAVGAPGRPAAPQAPPHAAPAPGGVAVPAPTRLHYEVTVQKGFMTLTGRAVFHWRHDGQAYEATLEASSPAGTRVQRSTGRITREGLAPDYFSDKARGEQATHFDRAGGRVIFSNNRPQAPLAEGMQDRLSVVVQLAAMVAGQPAKYPAGTEVAVATASTREADTWVFTVEGEEDLALPGGTVRALKLQRLPRREYDQKLELWLAPRMDYAPVRVRLTNPNGDAADQRWASTDRG
jgi:hypothetical protein